MTDAAFVALGVIVFADSGFLLWRAIQRRELKLGMLITAREHAPVFYFVLLLWLALLSLLGVVTLIIALHGTGI